MKLLTYSNTVKKNIHGNPDIYMDALLKKMQGKLMNLKIPSEITNDTLEFERPVQLFQYDRDILFKPIRKDTASAIRKSRNPSIFALQHFHLIRPLTRHPVLLILPSAGEDYLSFPILFL